MGRRRNKEQTIARLIAAVGQVLTEKGYAGIGVNKLSVVSGVSKPMIYQHFGGLSNLLKAYIAKKDYWLPYFESLELPASPTQEELRKLIIKIMQDQFRYFSHEKEMQKLILWQISDYTPLMRTISETREAQANRILGQAEQHFRGTGVSLKAVIALLVGGIYYNVLHHAAGTGAVSGIDLSNERDYELMINTVAQIIEMAWQHASLTNKNV